MYDAMADALEQVDADPTLRVALLTGTGDTFTSGNDITDFPSHAPVACATRRCASSRRFPRCKGR
jgi:enoyl-CoA hydratase/carnithine racemase